MNVLNKEGTMSDKEWEAVGLYMVFAFQKIKNESSSP